MNVLLLRDVAAVLLAGGAGERLYPLTRERAKPAVPFGGPYRIIDFTLSNCINSGLRKIFIATQYKSQSLSRHIRMGWNVVNREIGEFVEVLPPQKRVGEHWYLGTADAVFQNLYSLQRENPRWVIVLAGRPHLQDGLRQDAGCPHRAGSGAHGGRDRGAGGGRAPLRRPRGGRDEPHRRLPGEAGFGGGHPLEPGLLPRLDGRLHLRHGAPRARAAARRGGGHEPRLRQGHHSPARASRRARLRLPLLGREQEGVEVLARRGDARRLLRGEHGPHPGRPRLQPLRRRMADAHVPAAVPAREVRLLAGRTAGQRHRLHRLHGLHRLGERGPPLRPVPERARPLLLRHRGLDPPPPQHRPPPLPHPPDDRGPRIRGPERCDHRLRRGGGPPAPQRDGRRRRGRHRRRGVPGRPRVRARAWRTVHDDHRLRSRPRDPRQPRQPHRGGGGGARGGLARPGRGSFRRLHRRARGGGAPRRGQEALPRKGRPEGGGRGQRRDLRRAPRGGRARPGARRPAHDRPRRVGQQEAAGGERDPRGVPRGGQGRRRCLRSAPLPLRGRGERAHAARPLHEHPERGGPRRQQGGLPGVHDRAPRLFVVLGGAARGRRDLPPPQGAS